jgi:hypothetical protein
MNAPETCCGSRCTIFEAPTHLDCEDDLPDSRKYSYKGNCIVFQECRRDYAWQVHEQPIQPHPAPIRGSDCHRCQRRASAPRAARRFHLRPGLCRQLSDLEVIFERVNQAIDCEALGIRTNDFFARSDRRPASLRRRPRPAKPRPELENQLQPELTDSRATFT